MRFSVVTIFPELFDSLLQTSLLGRARDRGLIQVDFVDPRDFTSDRHRTVDDEPYGGGPGMVMKVEPLVAAIESVGGDSHRILLSPAGTPLKQDRVKALAARDEHLVLVCGRYEGIDERVAEICIDEVISVGDFVMTGGEIGAMAIIDAVSRYVPGVLGEATSTDEESFSDGLLEYPQYTRPQVFRDRAVPEVLRGGHHANIAAWREEHSLTRTARVRPELLASSPRPDGPVARLAARTYLILAHHPVYDRKGDRVTTAITNLDLHDIARAAATYGLAGYYITTPVEAQRDKVDRIVTAWTRELDGINGVDNRQDALDTVRVTASIEEAVGAIGQQWGARPLVVATSAQEGVGRISHAELVREGLAPAGAGRPLVLLFGTGWGLCEDVILKSDQVLEPVSGHHPFKHLSVRSAVSIICDRVFGLRS